MWAPEISIVLRACFQVTFLSISGPTFRRFGLPIPGVPIEGIAKPILSEKSFFNYFKINFYNFSEASGTFVLVFAVLKAGLK